MNFRPTTSSAERIKDTNPTHMFWAKILCRLRFQIIIALCFGVFAAIMISNLITHNHILQPWYHMQHYAISLFLAIILGFAFYTKIAGMPGQKTLSGVIPAFALSYIIIATIYFGLRQDIGRNQFIISFTLVICVQYAILYTLARLHRPVIGVIKGGDAQLLSEVSQVRWVKLTSLKKAKNFPHLGIAVDLANKNLNPEWESFIAQEVLKGRHIYNAKSLHESLSGKVQLTSLSENHIGQLGADALYIRLKHYIDFVMAFIALILLSPLLVIVAIMIRADSQGPALFKQKRMGYRGYPFTVYKFRSMRIQDENKRERSTDMTLSDDDRITKMGRFIRKTRIDELPQLINILKGEMSLIGPRPETIRLSEWYSKEIPFYHYRHIVKPGITGWAQTRQGHVTDLNDVKEKLRYDLYYIKHFSIWLDINIALLTVKVMLTGTGAK